MPAIARVEISKLIVAWRNSPAGLAWALSSRSQASREQRHPLCCVVSTSHSQAVSQSIDEGKLKICQLWKDLRAVKVHFANAGAFENINTPRDLRSWRRKQTHAVLKQQQQCDIQQNAHDKCYQ
jgi:molybdopterin-guanine dinucleotide biosynthesis protein A